jgi:hypothetical protein
MASYYDDAEFSMILVMGVTGSGKSYFVNQLQSGSARVGHTLESGALFVLEPFRATFANSESQRLRNARLLKSKSAGTSLLWLIHQALMTLPVQMKKS